MKTVRNKQSELHQLLERFEITPDDIAQQADLSVEQVILAISPYYCARCPLIFAIKAYCASERLLRGHGWKGEACQLWRSFFTQLLHSASNN